jgi:hypothetical protein
MFSNDFKVTSTTVLDLDTHASNSWNRIRIPNGKFSRKIFVSFFRDKRKQFSGKYENEHFRFNPSRHSIALIMIFFLKKLFGSICIKNVDSADIYILPEAKLEEEDEGMQPARVGGRHLKTSSF